MNATALKALGWKPCFEHQLSVSETRETTIVRVGAHFGSQVLCISADDEWSVSTSLIQSCGEVAVGDWLLVDPETHRATRRLDRESLIARRAAGEKAKSQLIAANLDTLFVVSSCNHDFNLSRLERYLALTIEAKVTPVVVLTKADECEDPSRLRQQAAQLRQGLIVEAIDARDAGQARSLFPWCRVGQTVAVVGSSGVGKSTLAMTLGAGELETQGIREDDSKGRHTTTARSIYHLDAGGLIIDTPGMRELQLADCEDGVAEVFDEIVELSKSCRFRDCTHQGEPGCAVQASIESGGLDSRRLTNYRKLQSEQARNAKSLREQRYDSRKLGQFYKSVQSSKGHRRDFNGDF
jgi:ribosome biogenesis GTPase